MWLTLVLAMKKMTPSVFRWSLELPANDPRRITIWCLRSQRKSLMVDRVSFA